MWMIIAIVSGLILFIFAMIIAYICHIKKQKRLQEEEKKQLLEQKTNDYNSLPTDESEINYGINTI